MIISKLIFNLSSPIIFKILPRVGFSQSQCELSLLRRFCNHILEADIPSAQLDYNYLLSENNINEIEANIHLRKGIGDIKLVHKLHRIVQDLESSEQSCTAELDAARNHLEEALKQIPNRTHPSVANEISCDPLEVRLVGQKKEFTYPPWSFPDLTLKTKTWSNDLIRTRNLTSLTGLRSYYLKDDLVELERALIKCITRKLLKLNFSLLSVPDILHPSTLEACGIDVNGQHTQVFCVDSPWPNTPLCLSGTSEMAIAGYFANNCLLLNKLPQRICSISRCYRAEVSGVQEEKGGIYRVHEFTKIEMFGLSPNETGMESEEMLKDFTDIQQEISNELGLHYRVLDMPPHELGAAAYRKFDIEAWFHGRKMFGELSSASNCTDFQSRRLGIKYTSTSGEKKHVHTVNGTACAIPRMLMAICEQYQEKKGDISIPDVLVPYMDGKTIIGKSRKQYFTWFFPTSG